MFQEGHPVTKQVILLPKIRGKHAHSALEVEHEVRLSTSPQYHTKCLWRIDVDIHVQSSRQDSPQLTGAYYANLLHPHW